MASTRALLVVAVAVLAAAALGTAHGASYTVGAPAGSWDLRTNYTLWESGVTFRAGDQLVFKYPRAAHNVLEVSRADHDACSSASPLNAFSTGDDVVPLPAGGVTRYFICGLPGHCDNGMKLAVRVQAADAPGTAAAPSPVATGAAPGAALPPMSAAGAPTVAMPPASSPASAGVDGSLVGLVLSAVVASLMAFC
ncbi:chemocyanin-like [Miscanthus floridulus]|uniref:chemocyanin-like n=1 Tax=Miscanthus floridulus TaxID=154761 RepID=UPI0034578DBE